MTTQAQPTSAHRIWSHAAAAAALMVLLPTLAVTISWFTDRRARDSDMRGVDELIFFLIMVLAVPAVSLAFGVLAPSAIILDRLARGQTSRFANMLLGTTLSVPAMIVFVVGAALIQTGFNFQAFVATLFRPFSPGHHPERVLIAMGFFALPGMIVALGMRYRGAQCAEQSVRSAAIQP